MVLPLQIAGIGPAVIGLLFLVVAIVAVYQAIVIVDAYEKKALTVFGEYRKLLEPGINVVPPFVSRTYTFDMRTQTLDVPRQEAITRDNSPVTADAVVYIKVMDAKKAFLEVEDYKVAVSNLAQTTLRAVLGDMELDDTLNKRQEINARIRKELDEPTDEWGIRVESVEVREVNPSKDVQQAMEQQTSAERRRRAMILEAQGERRSAVESAEGEKQSNIIRAQGEKQSQILEAQGDAISTVLRAKSAESMGERAIIDKGMETLEQIGQGESTTFVLPQELTSLVGRYGKQLTGSDVQDSEGLDSLEFDAETREMLGLDDIEDILGEIDEAAQMDTEALEQEAAAVKEGDIGGSIKSADEVVAEADEEGEPVDPADEVVTDDGAGGEDGDTAEPETEPETE
ncbi:SPFH domain-containing protein [Halobaculum gomorrense]|uniref:SPFH domain, Band 7 family protein n=1 Tax=Halobaculum gomorrense TaxID=43928 RepID=A0A1M5KLG5_9EURY|nr:SPFH domain-containing protein [Halobaculum gomorrense]SHG53535.1 SPFH domain, Band 7 family protein [Halobaculum gomorrense]